MRVHTSRNLSYFCWVHWTLLNFIFQLGGKNCLGIIFSKSKRSFDLNWGIVEEKFLCTLNVIHNFISYLICIFKNINFWKIYPLTTKIKLTLFLKYYFKLLHIVHWMCLSIFSCWEWWFNFGWFFKFSGLGLISKISRPILVSKFTARNIPRTIPRNISNFQINLMLIK